MSNTVDEHNEKCSNLDHLLYQMDEKGHSASDFASYWCFSVDSEDKSVYIYDANGVFGRTFIDVDAAITWAQENLAR